MLLSELNVWLIGAAGILSLATALIHIFLGGREIAKPLLASELKRVPKYTNYYCWHMVSIILVTMAGCYALALLSPVGWPLAVLATFLAWAFAIWSFVLMVGTKSRVIELPQWILFVSIGIPGLLGHIA